ncbi:hypothetical protein QAD02_018837 [Eretmocerus hayati]|uniref:Uncharacterized protein n=1 Tax=Eretmocerus hayati TaxID=131215 RepID=A0ACC2PHY5_9HYME|nr:hypothetical protein QAD02_018837 [Eretmocerus hayati]
MSGRSRGPGTARTSQVSDDEDDDSCGQGGGGMCPSCRLAVNKDTGRLKWCMGGNDVWRTRIRFMLLIPAVILPVVIIIIALSKSTVIGKLSMNGSSASNDASSSSSHRQQRSYIVSGHHNDIESPEIVNRLVHPDAETSFLPSEPLSVASSSIHRRKRAMNQHKPHRKLEEVDDVRMNESPRRIGRLAAAGSSPIETRQKWPKGQRLVRAAQHSSSEAEIEVKEKDDEKEKTESQTTTMTTTTTTPPQAHLEVKAEQPLIRQLDTSNQTDQRNETVIVQQIVKNVTNSEENDDVSEEDDCDEDEDSASNSASENSDESGEESSGDEGEDDGDDEGDSEEDEIIKKVEALLSSGSIESFGDNNGGSKNSKLHEIEDNEAIDYRSFWKGNWDEKFIRKAQAKMMLKYMDKTTDPCKDFYQYSCGNWEKYNNIPEDKAGFDTFEALRESLDVVLRQLLEERPPENSNIRDNSAVVKAKNLYRSCMNYEILEYRKERPLMELLSELGGWPILQSNWDPNKFDWLILTARLRLFNNNILISEWVVPDIKNSAQYVITFDQTTLGLPTKDFFLQQSNANYLKAYKDYLIAVAVLLGASVRNAIVQANELIEFEVKLANITVSPHEKQNVPEMYRHMQLHELITLIPQIDWQRYLTIVLNRPVSHKEPVVVFATRYLQNMVDLVNRTPRRVVSNYLLWRFVRHRINNLDDRFQDAKQTFYYELFGREKSPSRWKSCVAQVNSNMGLAVGSMFVKKYFDEKSKNDTLIMTREIQQSFRELLNESSWLDTATRRVAGEKVEAMQLRIGYPDFILDDKELSQRFKDVSIEPDKYFENTLNVLRHLTRVEHDRLGKPVDKTQWNAPPANVNAYYSRDKNQIIFPAGILQPPFYHRYFPRSLNYGGIGMVIGHEITHGFDDKGRLFDKYGNLQQWWSQETIDEFDSRASCLVDQYSKYIVDDVNMPIDGVNTQGENIADNGGIKQAFRAYKKWVSLNGNATENLPGLKETGEQLFFLNFAQLWCGSMRPEAMKNKLKTAVHPPGKFRLIGTLTNFEHFAKVFNCPVGSPMNPVNKCSVW